jgi:hypothetical protein
MKTRIAVIVSTMFLSTLLAAPSSGRNSSPNKIMLSIEPVLVDENGLHPLTGTTDWSRVELGLGGAFHQIVELEADRSDLLVYKLGYEPLDGDRIKLTLERTRERGGGREVLPPAEAVISLLDTWSTSLFDDPVRKRRVVLRLLPELRVQADDEPLDASRFVMRLYGGPLIRYGRREEGSRVVFSVVNTGGAGLEFGVPEIGVVRIHLRPFPGATRVGWVRGTTMSFDLGGQSFQAWSVKEILPEDPDRPGKGWVLYGALLPLSEARSSGGYYGGFQPGK